MWRSQEGEHRGWGHGHGWGPQGGSPWWGILKHLSPQRLWFPEAPGCEGLISVASVHLTWHLAQIGAQNLGSWTLCLVQFHIELFRVLRYLRWLPGFRMERPAFLWLSSRQVRRPAGSVSILSALRGMVGHWTQGLVGRRFIGSCSLKELTLEQNLQEGEELASRERIEPEEWSTAFGK